LYSNDLIVLMNVTDRFKCE